jgi:hypothetical protein
MLAPTGARMCDRHTHFAATNVLRETGLLLPRMPRKTLAAAYRHAPLVDFSYTRAPR